MGKRGRPGVIQQTGSQPYDPFLFLALRVIQDAARANDHKFFNSDWYDFWLDYVTVCLPQEEVVGRPLPRGV